MILGQVLPLFSSPIKQKTELDFSLRTSPSLKILWDGSPLGGKTSTTIHLNTPQSKAQTLGQQSKLTFKLLIPTALSSGGICFSSSTLRHRKIKVRPALKHPSLLPLFHLARAGRWQFPRNLLSAALCFPFLPGMSWHQGSQTLTLFYPMPPLKGTLQSRCSLFERRDTRITWSLPYLLVPNGANREYTELWQAEYHSSFQQLPVAWASRHPQGEQGDPKGHCGLAAHSLELSAPAGKCVSSACKSQ